MKRKQRGHGMKAFNRRQVLTSTTAALAGSTWLASNAPGEQTDAKAFLVRTGEAREGRPLIVQGDENAFSTKVRGADGNQRYSVIEVHTPPDRGPLLHIHPSQNELFFILHGSIGVQCGSERTILNAGDAFMAPANVPHSFVTLGTQESRMLNVFDPPGDMERFFQALASALNASGPPDEKKLASVYVSHGIEVVGPPLRAASFTVSKS
jgi:quercetin dioxygenase-like cupin family protein